MKFSFDPKINRPISRSFPRLAVAGRVRSYAADPFPKMVKLTDFRSIEQVKPYTEKVMALRKECFKHLPILEKYMLKIRGDARDLKYIKLIADGTIGAPCVRNEKRVRLSSDLEKSFFLFSFMDEIMKRTTCAVNYYKDGKEKGKSDIVPFVLFGFEKFRSDEIFVNLKPYTERFFGQCDDLGGTFWNARVMPIPKEITENHTLYFPTIIQDMKKFGAPTRITDKKYVGLADPNGGGAYLMEMMSVIAHYNLLKLAIHMLSYAPADRSAYKQYRGSVIDPRD